MSPPGEAGAVSTVVGSVLRALPVLLACLPLSVSAQDRDLDLVLDATDGCPDAGETYDGASDEDGCPEEGARPYFRVTATELVGSEPVRFQLEHPRILPESFPLLDALAALLLAHPELALLSVEGHMSPETWAEREGMANRLWHERAETVIDYLEMRGVPRARLVASMRTTDAPICDPSVLRRRRARRACSRQNDRIVVRRAR